MKYINVFKTHFDIGFTDLACNVVRKYGQMLKKVTEVCEATKEREKGKRFVWTMAAWPMLKAIEQISKAVEYDRETRKRLKERVTELIANGQIVIHALPYTLHTELLSEKDLEHLFDSADKFCKEYDVEFPIAAKMTDVPGHTCALIAPLVKKGVKFLHLGANRAATKPQVPMLFWWEDMQGNRILTFYSQTYGSSVLPPEEWKFPVWLALNQTGDNIGPQDPEVLEKIEATVREKDPTAEVLFGSLDDFYKELAKCDLSGLPVVKGDLGDTWIHGIGSYPKEVSMLRRARNIVKNVKLSEADEKKFYENSLLFSEHTWGCNMQLHMPDRLYGKKDFLRQRREGRYIIAEASWEEQRVRARICADIAEKYAPLYNDFSSGETENEYWKVEVEDGLKIVHKPSGTILRPLYEYETVSEAKIQKYLDEYVQFVCDWSIADNGRELYHEKESKCFESILTETQIFGGLTCATYETPTESYEEHGNAEKLKLFATVCKEKVFLRVILKNKHASPIVEGGNLVIETNLNGNKYEIKKIGELLDPEKDLVLGANSKFFCVSDLVGIDNIRINPIDSPLVSFGESAVYRYQAGRFEKPQKPYFVFNLFNNQWGTNFPQWTEGDELIFDYVISAK